MKTYEEFKAELTPEQHAKADELYKSAMKEWEGTEPLMVYSDRLSDADHFKAVPITQEELDALELDSDD